MKINRVIVLILSLFLSFSCTKKQEVENETIYGLLDANLKGLDPINAGDRYSSRIVSQIYEGLYNYHYLKRPLELQPQLAEAMPTISSDGLTYTIKIKKGLYFQDSEAFPGGKGRELTSDDFIYSWRRLADPKNKAQGFWIFDDRIVGLNEWRKGITNGKTNYKTPIEGLKSLDKHTLQIKLTKVFYQFPHLLAISFTKVVPHEAVKKYGPEFLNNPVGTGPFILEKWIRNSTITLIRNPNYRDVYYPTEGMPKDKEMGYLEDAGKKLPLTDRVVIREIPERQTAWLTFMQGRLDHTVVFKDAFDTFFTNGKVTPEMSQKGIQVFIESRVDYTFESMNMENSLFGKNKKIRQAIAHAIDKETMIKTFFQGRAIVAQGPIPPGITGYDPDFKNPYEYNLIKAKKLLTEAGFPDGKGLPIFNFELASNASRTRQQAEFTKHQLEKIGIRVKLKSNTWPQFDKKIKMKRADYFGMAWFADYPDGENFLQMFYSKNISPGSNSSNFVNREYDQMYEKVMTMPPGPNKVAMYKKMVRFITEEVPLIPLVHRTTFSPFHGWLKNFKENAIVSDFYKYLRVDKKKRAELKKKL